MDKNIHGLKKRVPVLVVQPLTVSKLEFEGKQTDFMSSSIKTVFDLL